MNIKNALRSMADRLISLKGICSDVFRAKAVSTIEVELEEMEHIFGLLVLGSFVGMPSPPAHLTLELMPMMEKELLLMMEKVDTAHDPLAQLFSTLDVG